MENNAVRDRTHEKTESNRREQSGKVRLGIDAGTFGVKTILESEGKILRKEFCLSRGEAIEAIVDTVNRVLSDRDPDQMIGVGLTGTNADLVAEEIGLEPVVEIEALQAGINLRGIECDAVLSLGHENMYYLELSGSGSVSFFNRNGQCAAGSGAFWYQQATRLGYEASELAEVALEASEPVKISGRCAVFAKSDMTHAINEGATHDTVAAGMAEALSDMIITGVAQNRLGEHANRLALVGGVANNKAVLHYLKKYCREQEIQVIIPGQHEYLQALGAVTGGNMVSISELLRRLERIYRKEYDINASLPPLSSGSVRYLEKEPSDHDVDTSLVYLGVDCGSVSTKCVLLDRNGEQFGGYYLPTRGRPALQVLDLINRVKEEKGELLQDAEIVACTTGSGRFLSQKILGAEYAVDEITCQAEGIKAAVDSRGNFSIIEIGGEDSKFLQLRDGVLYDYNMNPVCAAGTGTFLENLAGLLGVEIKGEFSQKAFEAGAALDLGDRCTLLAQSAMTKAASRGLTKNEQLASLAYSSAKNYISKTAENRKLSGTVIFTGATAKNRALASAFAGELGKEIIIPPEPELTGALGAAMMSKIFHERGEKPRYNFRGLDELNEFERTERQCRADCEHDHNCTLDVLTFSDESSFIYGDRCGRYSGMKKEKIGDDLPDYVAKRNDLFLHSAPSPQEAEVTVGIARSGMFFEMYPFWAGFFSRLGAKTVLSPETTQSTLDHGKTHLDSEMCYPMKVLVGHYRQLVEEDPDYIFLPEIVDMEPFPWAEEWPREFTCPLLQTIRGIVQNSLDLPAEKILYAQLNYKDGAGRITRQLKPVAEKILGSAYTDTRLQEAVDTGYERLNHFKRAMEEESGRVFDNLKESDRRIVSIFLGRPYTIYDRTVSKRSFEHARKRGMIAVPQEYILAYLEAWYEGRISSPFLGSREEFQKEVNEFKARMDNLYPIQLQKMISVALFVRYFNRHRSDSRLPLLRIIFQDPFKCGPNAFVRHYLNTIADNLRLTLDEHTAPAGMITRLEAFKNTSLSRNGFEAPAMLSAETKDVFDLDDKKLLVPQPTHHSDVFVSLFQKHGIDAQLLPQSQDSDLSKARRYVNGNECLPMIQNMQDYLDYLEGMNGDIDRLLFFQGAAWGPCRYGLYAPTQSLLLNKAGYGAGRICSVKLDEVIEKFGIKFVISSYDGMVAVDLLYKMLHSVRPYEKRKGESERVFAKYIKRLNATLKEYEYGLHRVLTGGHLTSLEEVLRAAGDEFRGIETEGIPRPRIVVAGEFYVRLDERSNQNLLKQIEDAGGEVLLSPASELFSFTNYINYQEARQNLRLNKKMSDLTTSVGQAFTHWLAKRDEHRLAEAAGGILQDSDEPSPEVLSRLARTYISAHYGGEPPMTMGRIRAFATRERVCGAIVVAPFTCMPGSIVEAQLKKLRRDTDLPIVAIDYDGREDGNREEFIEGLVFQAQQKLREEVSGAV